MRQTTRLVIALGLAVVLATPVALAARSEVDQLILELGAAANQAIRDAGANAGATADAGLDEVAALAQALPGTAAATTGAAQDAGVAAGGAATATSEHLTQQAADALAAVRDADEAPVENSFASADLARGFLYRTEDRVLAAEAAALLPLAPLVASAEPPLPTLAVIELGSAAGTATADLVSLVVTVGHVPPDASAFVDGVVAYATVASDYPSQFFPTLEAYASAAAGAAGAAAAATAEDAVATSGAIADAML